MLQGAARDAVLVAAVRGLRDAFPIDHGEVSMRLLCSLSVCAHAPTDALRLRLQQRRAAGRESGTHARTRGEAVSGPPSRHPVYGSWAPRI